jgi:hypothetical protein
VLPAWAAKSTKPMVHLCCVHEEDNVDHILAQCKYVTMRKQVWFGCLQGTGLQIAESSVDTKLENWWTEAREQVQPADRINVTP